MNVLAIDQGTSATKALLVGPGAEVLGRGEVPVRTRSVGADGVEADPEELFDSVLAAGRRALAAAGAPAHAVALANQGETVLAWDRGTGRPLSPAIVWQDRRSAGVCARLAGRGAELAAITGLPLDPYFAAPKMTWLRENLTAEGTVTTTDTWLLHRLGAGYVTDAATASRTMLLDLDSATWSEPACAAFGLDPAGLPAVADCAGIVGETSLFGPGGPHRRDRRRPAGRAAGRGLPGRGRRQVHLRHGRVPAGHHRVFGGPVRLGAVLFGRLAARWGVDILPGWPGVHGGFRAAVAHRHRRARRAVRA